MALIRSLFQRFMQNKRKAQEEHDVWKLYHLLYYHQQSRGREVQVDRPPDVAYQEQYRLVHSLVTEQVRDQFISLDLLCVLPTVMGLSTHWVSR